MTEGDIVITEIWYMPDLVNALVLRLIISAIIKTTKQFE
jgi:hypothetical protein